ncbi:hypothetical protein M426DRAFT_267883 [Hypoxylon sp. CI-4A]|nr:hypothetical protein M426DRAFT_267883 [Hypoxylon sp. CI-4A]
MTALGALGSQTRPPRSWRCELGSIVYRLFLHPLAGFPGPKLAAATLWYEFYYDGIKPGRYTFKIGELHEKYGPIVRISPEELHCNDPGFIDTLYAGGSTRRDKYEFFTKQFGVHGAVHHNLHRLRRTALNRFFSKASVSKLEPMILDKVEKLCQQLGTHIGDENPVRLEMAFSCFSTDVVAAYSFSKSYGFLEDASFEHNYRLPMAGGLRLTVYFKHFPFIIPFMKSLPDLWVAASMPRMSAYFQYQRSFRDQIAELKIQKESGKSLALGDYDHPSIFNELLESDLPEQEKTTDRLWQECQNIIGAGTETSAWTLSILVFYVLSDRTVYDKLMAELETAIPDPMSRPSWNELEKLPYLISYHHFPVACITEALRLSYGVISRLQRVSPDGPMLYHPSNLVKSSKSEYVIPQGTPVGMSSALIHHNPDIFPRSNEFDPSRWLDEKGNIDHSLDKYMISFSKGSRQCVGMNLAYAELFIATGLIFRRLGSRMKLYETDHSDIEMMHDYFVPVPKLDSKGVRVLLA